MPDMPKNEAKTFRTRSAERDRSTDMQRRQAIVTAIDEQRRLALTELEGLTARMGQSFGHVAFALDASGDYDERDAADEADISTHEAEALNARARVTTLMSEIALMDELKARVAN
jgi:hypothetical protein